jgi:uncharacterized membrane protein YkvI
MTPPDTAPRRTPRHQLALVLRVIAAAIAAVGIVVLVALGEPDAAAFVLVLVGFMLVVSVLTERKNRR